MKEIEDKSQDKEIAIHVQQSTLKLINQQALVSGVPIWCLNIKTKQLDKAQVVGTKMRVTPKDKRYAYFEPQSKIEKVYDIISSPDLLFVQAINRTNAARKFMRAGYL